MPEWLYVTDISRVSLQANAHFLFWLPCRGKKKSIRWPLWRLVFLPLVSRLFVRYPHGSAAALIFKKVRISLCNRGDKSWQVWVWLTPRELVASSCLADARARSLRFLEEQLKSEKAVTRPDYLWQYLSGGQVQTLTINQSAPFSGLYCEYNSRIVHWHFDYILTNYVVAT